MNYLEKKKKAMMNAIQVQPSGYDVTITTYNSGGYKVDVTINGVTTTYTMAEVEANNIDCGCLYLTYRKFGGSSYAIVSKGTLTYNGVEYSKGKVVNEMVFNTYDTFEYSGVDEPTPSGTTEWYMTTNAKTTIFTDTDTWFGIYYSGTPHQFGCIEWDYVSSTCKIYATKPLTYNGVNYNTGDLVRSFGYGTVTDMIFEEL